MRVRAGGGLPVMLAAVAVLLAGCTAASAAAPSPSPSPSPSQPASRAAARRSPAVTPTPTPRATASDDPASLRVVVDKRRPLRPKDFVPPDLVAVPVPHTNPPQLRREAAGAVFRLVHAADAARLRLLSISAYRSFASQQRVYGKDLKHYGRAGADRQTARPGYSEHQTGLAIDLGARSGRCALAECFGTIPEGRWIAANAWRFGFVLRYPKGAERITGYEYEPWHLRYVGTGLAAAMHAHPGEPLERYLGVPDAPTY